MRSWPYRKKPIQRLTNHPAFFGTKWCFKLFAAPFIKDVFLGSSNPITELVYVLMHRAAAYYNDGADVANLRRALTLVNAAHAQTSAYKFESGMTPVIDPAFIFNVRVELIIDILLSEDVSAEHVDRALLVYDEATKTQKNALPNRRAAVMWLSDYVDVVKAVKEGHAGDVADRARNLVADLGEVKEDQKALWKHCFRYENDLHAQKAKCDAVSSRTTRVARPLVLVQRASSAKGNIDAFAQKLAFTLSPEFAILSR